MSDQTAESLGLAIVGCRQRLAAESAYEDLPCGTSTVVVAMSVAVRR